jgi:hypothetical protein
VKPDRHLPAECVADLLATTKAVEHAARTTRWERVTWYAAFLLVGLAMGAVTTAIINYIIP